MGHSDIKMTENYAKMLTKEMKGAYGRPAKTSTTEKMGGDK